MKAGWSVRYVICRSLSLIWSEWRNTSGFHRPCADIAFAGDWSFAEALYGTRLATDDGYVQKVLRATWNLDEASISRIKRVRALTAQFRGLLHRVHPVGEEILHHRVYFNI